MRETGTNTTRNPQYQCLYLGLMSSRAAALACSGE
jgi:hypothetical protein